MALMDAEATFTYNKRLNADGTTDVIDVKKARFLGVGPKKLYLVVRVVDSLDSGSNNETYKLTIRTNDNLNTAGTQLDSTGRVDLMDLVLERGLVAGSTEWRVVPAFRFRRYVEIAIDVGGTTPDGDVVIALTNNEPETYLALPAVAV